VSVSSNQELVGWYPTGICSRAYPGGTLDHILMITPGVVFTLGYTKQSAPDAVKLSHYTTDPLQLTSVRPTKITKP